MMDQHEHETKHEIRRREVEEYMRTRTSEERELMRELAEANMDHTAELLARAEHEGEQF